MIKKDNSKQKLKNKKIQTPSNILVVEDDKGLNRLIRKTLNKEGFFTIGFLNGTSAIPKINSIKNSILLLDYVLPDMTGKQVIETIVKKGYNIPFIIMTGHGDEKIAAEMMKMGAWDYLVKDGNFLGILPEIAKKVAKEVVRERKLERAMKMLKDSEEKFRTITENTNDIIYSTDANGIITYISPQIKRYGLAIDNVMAKKIIDLVIFKDKKKVVREYQNILSHGLEFPIEFRLKDQKGNIYWLEEHGKVQLDENGKILGINGILRDITERKLTEEKIKKLNENLEKRVKQRTIQLEKIYQKLKNTREKIHEAQKKELIGILAGGIAKEFNNIITELLDNIKAVRSSLGQKDLNYKLLTRSHQACLRAKELTGQLITYSNMGAPNRKITSIEELMKYSADPMINSSKTKLEISIPDNIHLLEVDNEQIQQVLKNLIINADQAISNGGIIKVSAENVLIDKELKEYTGSIKHGKYVKISIEDNGIGIPIVNIHKVFEPYFTTKDKSVGMGLAISRSIIKHHNGYISVDSAPGMGTTVSIYLPVSELASSLPIGQMDSKNNGPITIEHRKLLVMDDDKTMYEFLQKKLKQLGYDTVFAKNGAETIELYERSMGSSDPFDIVVLDIPIPGSLGCKNAIQQLLKIDPELKAIVSSYFSEDKMMVNHTEYGFKGMIAKPYNIEELNGALVNVNDKKVKNR